MFILIIDSFNSGKGIKEMILLQVSFVEFKFDNGYCFAFAARLPNCIDLKAEMQTKNTEN